MTYTEYGIGNWANVVLLGWTKATLAQPNKDITYQRTFRYDLHTVLFKIRESHSPASYPTYPDPTIYVEYPPPPLSS